MNFNRTDLTRPIERIVGEGIERAEEADLTASRISEVVWPVIQYFKDRKNEPFIETERPLSAEAIRLIVIKTGRFRFLQMTDHHLIFWDATSEKEMIISQPHTLSDLMARITDLYRQEGECEGEEKAKRKMRGFLGL